MIPLCGKATSWISTARVVSRTPEQRVQPGEPDFGIDVDMAAQRRRAQRNDLVDQALRPFPDRRAQLPAQLALARDPFGDRIAGPVRLKRHAEQRLVEMHMAVDEAGDEQRAREIDRRRAGVGSRAGGIDARDAAVADSDIDPPPVGEQSVGEPRHGINCIRRAATT